MAFDYKTQPFTTLDTAFSDKCCLTCGFCYARHNKNPFNQDCLNATFNWFYGQYNKLVSKNAKNHNVSINFYGGEPLVEWENLIKEIPLRTQQAKALDIKPNFCIVSNLALLTDEKISWLKEHNVGISCSIDGCQEAEDYWRKFPDGKGASSLVYPNAEKLIKLGMTTTVRMTSTPETVQWFSKSVKFLEELGYQNINCVTASGQNWDDKALSIYKEQLAETTDWWMEKVRHNCWRPLYYLNKRFPMIWGMPKDHVACGAGLGMICADTKGYLWPCHRFAGGDPNSKYCLGTVYEGLKNFDMLSRIPEVNFTNWILTPNCAKCQSKFACNTHCLNEMANNHETVLPSDCAIVEIQTKEAIRAHNTLMTEKNPLFLEHYRTRQPKHISKKDHEEYLKKLKEFEAQRH